MMEEPYYEQVGVAVTCRGYTEYERMFALDEAALRRGEVLDVASGASSFAAEARSRGVRVISVDPRYAMTAEELGEESRAEIETSAGKLAGLMHLYDWSYYGSMERHKAMRLESLRTFLRDYAEPGARRRYVAASLPSLPFEDGRFALVLCSHFLFLYGEQFDEAFHQAALVELLRVCEPGGEVRVYPVVTLRFRPYAALAQLIAHLEALGASCSLDPAGLPFLPNSDRMLVVRKRAKVGP